MKPVKTRDPRLDFFRGLGMFIILIAHINHNPWALWIPARFGFSDATEMFVFCSGLASAFAFGAVYRRAGWMMGTLNILNRVWQVYWVHIGVFFSGLVLLIVLNASGLVEGDLIEEFNLKPFLNETGPNLIGLFTLTYVPNFFDILPMYLVILALVPVMMALARVDVRLAIGFSLVLWAISATGVNLPAEWWFSEPSDRPWFFNPFAWQLIFFTGFALAAGWIPAPPVQRTWILAAGVIVGLSVPLNWYYVVHYVPPIQAWRADWAFLFDKTQFGLLRYVHFLALAYLAWVAVGVGGAHLRRGGWSGLAVQLISRVGQQTLAVFAASTVIAFGLGVWLEVLGGGPLAAIVINLVGFASLIAVAAVTTLFKTKPWSRPPEPAVTKPHIARYEPIGRKEHA